MRRAVDQWRTVERVEVRSRTKSTLDRAKYRGPSRGHRCCVREPIRSCFRGQQLARQCQPASSAALDTRTTRPSLIHRLELDDVLECPNDESHLG